MPVKTVEPNKSIEQKQPEAKVAQEYADTKKDNTNYWLGALALAASAVAGLYISKGRNSEVVQDVVPKSKEIVHRPHLKDNFLTALGVNTDEVPLGVRNEYELIKNVTLKNGITITKSHGVKRVEDYSPIASIRRTLFETDEGKKLAEAFRNGDGEVVKYTVWDRDGRVLRTYDFEDGITHKFVYDKNGNQVSEVHYDREGWSKEILVENDDYLNKKEFEFGVNPDEEW